MLNAWYVDNTSPSNTTKLNMSEAFDPVEQASGIGKTISKDITLKYAKGQIEHGGNFFEKPTAWNIREEIIDLVSYTHVLLEHRDKLCVALNALYTKASVQGASKDLLQDIDTLIKQATDL